MPTIPLLPVDPHWTCQRSGDCCTKPAEVVMTKEEAAAIVHAAPPTIRMEFRPVDAKFVALKAGPCPLFAFQTCMVYAVRPYNCRRYNCLRSDTKSEKFDVTGSDVMEKINRSRPLRRFMQKAQRHAQRWAIKHGWELSPTSDVGE